MSDFDLPYDVRVTTLPATRVVDRAAAAMLLRGKVPPHFQGIIEAVRDFACNLTIVLQGTDPFAPPAGEPWVVLIADDLLFALGPDGFDRGSLEEIVRRCGHASVVTGEPLPLAYNAVATCAACWRQNAVVIETQPERQDAWLDLLRSVNPQIGITVSITESEAAS